MQFSIVGYRKMVLQGGDGGWLLGWVDFDLGSSPGWWAATVDTYCPSRMVEHSKSNSTQPSLSPDAPDCIFVCYFGVLIQSDSILVLCVLHLHRMAVAMGYEIGLVDF